MAGKGKRHINHYCDTAMAIRKKLIPCNKNCSSCIACIIVRPDGTKEHLDNKER